MTIVSVGVDTFPATWVLAGAEKVLERIAELEEAVWRAVRKIVEHELLGLEEHLGSASGVILLAS